MRTKNLVGYAVATALILLGHLVAMQFTDEVAWGLFDFVLAGVLLFGSGLAYELLAGPVRSRPYQAGAAVAVVAALALAWLNLAVGIIGTEDDPANLMYLGVLAVGVAGAALARLRPTGMALVLTAMAVAQVMVAVIALSAGRDATPALDVIFAGLWMGSALLFRRAGDVLGVAGTVE
jgi:hypothetical protein